MRCGVNSAIDFGSQPAAGRRSRTTSLLNVHATNRSCCGTASSTCGLTTAAGHVTLWYSIGHGEMQIQRENAGSNKYVPRTGSAHGRSAPLPDVLRCNGEAGSGLAYKRMQARVRARMYLTPLRAASLSAHHSAAAKLEG